MKKYCPALLLLIVGCSGSDKDFDAMGSFEAVETIVSSEASGKIMALNLNEGDSLGQGAVVGFIDSMQLHLTKLQLLQNQKAILSGRPNVQTQVEALEKELESAVAD